MKIIPVLDVMNGVVVHAIAGKRSEYRPISSRLTSSTDPPDLLRALIDATGSDRAYLADLDAITGKTAVSPAVRKLIESMPSAFTLWLDAGVRSASDLDSLATSNEFHARIVPVLGSESLRDWNAVPLAIERFGSAIVSLDFVNGRLQSNAAEVEGVPFVGNAKSHGVNEFIVLDLAAVGTGQERTSMICTQLLERFPDLQLYPGGGIRDRRDLDRFESLGVAGVLVASALHNGNLP